MEPTLPTSVKGSSSNGTTALPQLREKASRWRSVLRRITSKESRRSSTKFLILWLRLVWLDLLAMICALIIAYFFNSKVKVFRQNQRTFAMWRRGPNDWHGQTYISHPKQHLILTNLVAGLIFSVGPIGILVCMQVFVRNFWDMHMAVLGLVKGLVTITFVQTTLKILFGAFRPFFLEVCQPDLAELEDLYARRSEAPSAPLWAPVSICRGEKNAIRSAMQSFPSGHTGTATTVGVFLALYLNAKLKAFSDYQTSYWKMIAVLSPLGGAGCVAGLLVIDGNHHLRDVVPSMIIGAFVGYWTYRAHYRSAFYFHNNHLPLPYHSFTGKLREHRLAQEWEEQRALAVRWPVYEDEERLH